MNHRIDSVFFHFRLLPCLLLLSYLHYSVYSTTICYTKPTEPEIHSVLDFYNATNGAKWYQVWPVVDGENNPCNDWYGVQCELVSGQCTITMIAVPSNNLVGTLPSSIGSFTNLQALKLGTNGLIGSIPWSLGSLSQLQKLFLQSNRLTGSIPSSLGNLTILQDFDLGSNQIIGSIPLSLCKLAQLQKLYLYNNHLTGSIPSLIGNLSQLQVLSLYGNMLTGGIPASIGDLSQLQYLYLYGNQLIDRIPSSFGNLSSMLLLSLYDNQLTGSIPSSFGKLQQLTELDLFFNRLSGSIPASLGSLSQLQTLFVYGNRLTGCIPASLGTLLQLINLDFNSNQLSGSIPQSIGSLLRLQTLILYNNFLNGTIPSTIGELSMLNYLFLQNNRLSGSIPSTISLLSNLQTLGIGSNNINLSVPIFFPGNLSYIDAANCSIDSTLPTWLLRLQVSSLDLSFNQFSGNLPDEIWNTSVQQLLLNNNQFIGKFPSMPSYLSICSIHSLSISDNFLSGNLPAQLSSCSNLTQFLAANMQLSGSVQGLFSSQRNLVELVLSNNSLSGKIEDIFESSIASNLILNAAYNQFSGSLPMNSLSSGRYSTLILTENCLSGSLNAEVLCGNVNMTYMLLSGLHSATSCRSTVLSSALSSRMHVYSSYIVSKAFGGSLPSCLFTLPQLTFLALSGNRITGSLPSSILLPTTLQGLDLSHNSLVGSIPEAIFQANLSLLDLSFNRLSGTISESATDYYALSNTSQVSLQVNQLSGALPKNWIYALDINVLEGNMFACSADSLTKAANNPVHDPSSLHYDCGSSSTNLSLLIFLVVGVTFMSIMFLANYLAPAEVVKDDVHRLLGNSQTTKLTADKGLFGAQPRVLLIILAMLMLSMGLYASTSLLTGEYADMYVWVVSLSLQQGVVAGVVLLVWLSIICGCVLVLSTSSVSCEAVSRAQLERQLQQQSQERTSFSVILQESNAEARNSSISGSTLYYVSILIALMCISLVTVLVVNIVYVYTITLPLSDQQRLLTAMSMAIFKLGWNTMLNIWLLQSKVLVVSLNYYGLIRTLRYVGLFNLVLSPLLTEIFISPNCFKYLFARIPASSYAVQDVSCYWITYFHAYSTSSSYFADSFNTAFPCMTAEMLQQTYNSGSPSDGNYGMNIISISSSGQSSTINYQAGFEYNYQCTFSLLKAFAFVFVYRYVIGIFFLPVIWIALKQAQSYLCSIYGPSNLLCRIVNLFLPSLMKMYDDNNISWSEETLTHNELYMNQHQEQFRHKLNANLLVMRVSSDIAVALSFGVMFPPLGLLAVGSILSDMWWTDWMLDRLHRHYQQQLSLRNNSIRSTAGNTTQDPCTQQQQQQHRGSKPTAPAQRYYDYAKRVRAFIEQSEQTYNIDISQIISDVPTILCFAVVLWAFALYDIVGRESGTIQSLWVFCLVLTMPWWCWYVVRGARWMAAATRRVGYRSSSSSSSHGEKHISMKAVKSSAVRSGGVGDMYGDNRDVESSMRSAGRCSEVEIIENPLKKSVSLQNEK